MLKHFDSRWYCLLQCWYNFSKMSKARKMDTEGVQHYWASPYICSSLLDTACQNSALTSLLSTITNGYGGSRQLFSHPMMADIVVRLWCNALCVCWSNCQSQYNLHHMFWSYRQVQMFVFCNVSASLSNYIVDQFTHKDPRSQGGVWCYQSGPYVGDHLNIFGKQKVRAENMISSTDYNRPVATQKCTLFYCWCLPTF